LKTAYVAGAFMPALLRRSIVAAGKKYNTLRLPPAQKLT